MVRRDGPDNQGRSASKSCSVATLVPDLPDLMVGSNHRAESRPTVRYHGPRPARARAPRHKLAEREMVHGRSL
jgi:hypothetical protein